MLRFQWERAQLTQLAMYLAVFGALVSLRGLPVPSGVGASQCGKPHGRPSAEQRSAQRPSG